MRVYCLTYDAPCSSVELDVAVEDALRDVRETFWVSRGPVGVGGDV